MLDSDEKGKHISLFIIIFSDSFPNICGSEWRLSEWSNIKLGPYLPHFIFLVTYERER